MGIVRRYPIVFAILAFVLINLPGAVNAWWSLVEKFKEVDMPSLNFGVLDWIFPLLGLALFMIVIWQIRKMRPTIASNNDATPSQLEDTQSQQPQDLSTNWLLRILDDDKINLGIRVYTGDYQWSFDGLAKTDPYIEVVFTAINAAVFAIVVKGFIGRFLIEGQECAQEAEITGSTRIPHGERGNMCIRQRLTKEMAELIIGRRDLIPTSKADAARKGKVNIRLKACRITINSDIEGESPQTTHIAAGGDYEVNVP